MAKIALKGNPIHTSGHLPGRGAKAPDFHLVDQNLATHSLKDYPGKKKILATVPSLDTDVCSMMAKHLNEFGKKHPHVQILIVSADLPFAQKRFCSKEQVSNVATLSMMRDKEFGKIYGVLIQDGPLAGLLARSLLVLDERDHIVYGELVSEIAQEPDYHRAFEALEDGRM